MIIPAIDILDDKAVRLTKGNYNEKTIYGSPLDFALKFKNMGIEFLHIVDLNAAKQDRDNFDVIRTVSEIIKIQVGGGIRDDMAVDKYLEIADRIILGTVAVQNPNFVCEMVNKHGAERIVVGVDVLDGKVRTNGWLENSGLDYLEFIEMLPCKYILCTDISKDGTLTSPNWQMYEKIKERFPEKKIIVSGGVSKNEHLQNPYYATIVGKAYYEGRVSLC